MATCSALVSDVLLKLCQQGTSLLRYGLLAGLAEGVSKSKSRVQEDQGQLEDDLYGDIVPESFAEDGGLQDKVQEVDSPPLL